ncbi:glycoside hydrolase family 113 [Clostridium lundense]|uniref:glycoside hydrolase family 113 n=1 Tax=Clostridium lundense TaxID=319475 RepID=UPI00047F984F|nr:hypothetical protein [Clostridium lundense]
MKIFKNGKIVMVIAMCIIWTYLLGCNFPSKFYFYNGITNKKNILDGNIKSGSLSPDYNIDQVLVDIKKFNLNTINLPIIIDIESLSSSDMKVNKESKQKAIKLLKELKPMGINVILEPYPWIKSGTLYETDWKPNDINQFFWNWKTKVLKDLIDSIALPYKVQALNVASNFVHMEYAEGYWCDTIDYVRKYYKGLITYRTCWWYTAKWDKITTENYEKKLNNKLFSKVDFISVASYFELSDKDENTTNDLVSYIYSSRRYNREQNIYEELKKFYTKYNKSIFFGELGFPRKKGAAVEPWNPWVSNVENSMEQGNCFEAYRRVFEKEPWILGFSVFAVGENGKDKNYYPGSEAENVIKKWYSK